MTIPKLTVINGGKSYTSQPRIINQNVNVSNGRRIPAGAVITNQSAANCLPFKHCATRAEITQK